MQTKPLRKFQIASVPKCTLGRLEVGMKVQHKPLPALYTVYVLRSTVRHASLYIGSTPNPPRRLKQHNGEVKGGAVRTSREKLRPWEMITIVSGFPSMIAALKFEWALANPNLSLHIPSASRLAVSTKKKANGRPRRPPLSLKSVMSNLHLLTSVPSFARWPLNVHFFASEAQKAWDTWLKNSGKTSRAGLNILTDFAPQASTDSDDAEHGIHALPLDYKPLTEYVSKAQEVVGFEQEGACVHCHENLAPADGLQPMCPGHDCKAMGHLDCWSRHALAQDTSHIIPDICQCPSCGSEVRWGDMMKELSLRVRGGAEVEKLLKKSKRAKSAEKLGEA